MSSVKPTRPSSSPRFMSGTLASKRKDIRFRPPPISTTSSALAGKNIRVLKTPKSAHTPKVRKVISSSHLHHSHQSQVACPRCQREAKTPPPRKTFLKRGEGTKNRELPSPHSANPLRRSTERGNQRVTPHSGTRPRTLSGTGSNKSSPRKSNTLNRTTSSSRLHRTPPNTDRPVATRARSTSAAALNLAPRTPTPRTPKTPASAKLRSYLKGGVSAPPGRKLKQKQETTTRPPPGKKPLVPKKIEEEKSAKTFSEVAVESVREAEEMKIFADAEREAALEELPTVISREEIEPEEMKVSAEPVREELPAVVSREEIEPEEMKVSAEPVREELPAVVSREEMKVSAEPVREELPTESEEIKPFIQEALPMVEQIPVPSYFPPGGFPVFPGMQAFSPNPEMMQYLSASGYGDDLAVEEPIMSASSRAELFQHPPLPYHSVEGNVDPISEALEELRRENLSAVNHVLRFNQFVSKRELNAEKINRDFLGKSYEINPNYPIPGEIGEASFSFINLDVNDQEQIRSLRIAKEYTQLTLSCCLISDEQLRILLAKLPNLRTVTLFMCPHLTGDVLKHFQGLNSLHISCCEGIVDPADLVPLVRQSPSLERFEWMSRVVTPALLQALVGCNRLCNIDFAYCTFHKRALLESFSGKKNLKTLNLTKTEIPFREEKITRFREQCPGVRLVGIDLPVGSSSVITHAAAQIAPIPTFKEGEAKAEFLRIIQEEMREIYPEICRENNFEFFRDVGQPLKFFHQKLAEFKIKPEETGLDALAEVEKMEAFLQAADDFIKFVAAINQQYPFLDRGAENYLAIVRSLGLREKIGSLNLSNLELRRIPYTFYTAIFPNLEVVDLEGNHLRKVPEQFFWGCPLLTVLNLAHNRISHLANLAKLCQNLKQLFLNSNQLTSFPMEMIEWFCGLERNRPPASWEDWSHSLEIRLQDNPNMKIPPEIGRLRIYLGSDLSRPIAEACPYKPASSSQVATPRWKVWKKKKEEKKEEVVGPPYRVAVLVSNPLLF